MCGIVGTVNVSDDVSEMVASLKHRGPDDSGIWRSPDDKVVLGHTRLAILDLSHQGHQPMVEANGQVALVYNGEIYNYPELRDGFLKSGGQLRSGSDTELFLKLYLQDGIACLQRFVGMFAFGLYDTRKQTLFLGRDRAGKKPLYWYERNGQFAFASELKAFCSWSGFEKRIDTKALLNYLQFDYVPTPGCIYDGAHKLPPGHYLTLKQGEISTNPFWKLNASRHYVGSYEDACAQMDDCLNEAVRCRLLSDVPLGVFLSGGLDSSTVAYYATRHHHRIKTFSIAFEDKSYDESEFAQLVANHLETDHSVWEVGASDLLGMLKDHQLPIDEPLGDTSIVPTFFLAQKTRQSVTVALGGDGGDELFAGYPTYMADSLARWANWVPHFVWKFGGKFLDQLIKPNSQYLSANFKLKQFMSGMVEASEYRHQKWLGSFSYSCAKDLLEPDQLEEVRGEGPFEGLGYWEKDIQYWPEKNGILYEYFRTYLMDEVMVKVDRACMATSLEARSPLLDHRVVELAFSFPFEWKFHWGKEKKMLKDLMGNRLPKEILARPKKGFGMPIAQWLKTDLAEWTRAQLSVLDQAGISVSKALALHDFHLSGKADLRKPLWNLIALALFLQHVHNKH